MLQLAALASQRLAVRALTAPPAAAYHVRAALSLLAESAEDGGEDTIARVVRDELPDPDREAGRRARGEYQTALTLDDIDEWVRAIPEDGTGELEVEATGQMASGASAAATAEDAAADAAAADAAADDAADAAAAATAAAADAASEERAAEDAEERPMSQADIDEWLGAQTGDVDQSVLDAMRGIADQAAMRVPAARAAAVPPAPGRNADQGEAGLRWTASSCTSGIEAWGRWSQTERDITLELPVADQTRGKQVRHRRRALTRRRTLTRARVRARARTQARARARARARALSRFAARSLLARSR